MSRILPTAEPFFFPGDAARPGCLLTHGFTGAPKEMRWMGERLARLGHSVLGIRLAGHATQPQDMIRSRYPDWMASVEDGYHLLGGAARGIYLLGLSMGGALSLLMSTRLPGSGPAAIRGVVAISTPYALPRDYPLWLLRVTAAFHAFMPKSHAPPGSGWFDRQAWQEHVAYPQNPVRSAAELKLLLAEMRRALPRVRAPTLLIHSRDDTYVLPANATRVFGALGAPDKQLLWLAGSGHVVTRDAQREQALEATVRFIEKTEAGA
jgi:carboxylesterase